MESKQSNSLHYDYLQTLSTQSYHLQTNDTTIELLCYGYFRVNGFFRYNIKLDDFINIISNYINEFSVKFGKDLINIDTFFKNGFRAISMDIFDKKFFIAIAHLQYSIVEKYNHYLLSIFLVKINLFVCLFV